MSVLGKRLLEIIDDESLIKDFVLELGEKTGYQIPEKNFFFLLENFIEEYGIDEDSKEELCDVADYWKKSIKENIAGKIHSLKLTSESSYLDFSEEVEDKDFEEIISLMESIITEARKVVPVPAGKLTKGARK